MPMLKQRLLMIGKEFRQIKFFHANSYHLEKYSFCIVCHYFLIFASNKNASLLRSIMLSAKKSFWRADNIFLMRGYFRLDKIKFSSFIIYTYFFTNCGEFRGIPDSARRQLILSGRPTLGPYESFQTSLNVSDVENTLFWHRVLEVRNNNVPLTPESKRTS